jgi:hypothetical protein
MNAYSTELQDCTSGIGIHACMRYYQRTLRLGAEMEITVTGSA